MTCQPEAPCGGSLRFFDATDAAQIYSCLNGHHFLVGVPPQLGPSTATVQMAPPAPCRYCHRLIAPRRKGQVVHPECKSEYRRAVWRKRRPSAEVQLAHDLALAKIG